MGLPAHTLSPGTLLGNHKIIGLRGAGAMGAVYEAVHALLGKRVAIKLMHASLVSDAGLVDRFLREGRAASAIRHPNVVQIFDVGFHQGRPYLVMEFLEGRDLCHYLNEHGSVPAKRACDILVPLVSAVAAAHSSGVVHRDLKPANIFMDRGTDGVPIPKVVDFGISKFSDGGIGTLTQQIIGSPAYMAPEQCRGHAGPASDQWSLGVILYELCTGRLPFIADTQIALITKICQTEAPSPRSLGFSLPPAVEEILLRVLRPAAADRFPSLQILGEALLPLASRAVYERYQRELTLPQAPTQSMVVLPNPDAAPDSQKAEPPAERSTLPAPALRDSLAPKWRRAEPSGSPQLRAIVVGVSAAALVLTPVFVWRLSRRSPAAEPLENPSRPGAALSLTRPPLARDAGAPTEPEVTPPRAANPPGAELAAPAHRQSATPATVRKQRPARASTTIRRPAVPLLPDND